MLLRPHYVLVVCFFFCFFFFNDTATTEIYTLSLHDALPICQSDRHRLGSQRWRSHFRRHRSEEHTSELQSRGLISYAVFCLKKKKTHIDRNKLRFNCNRQIALAAQSSY